MSSFELQTDAREEQYGRLASSVIATLRKAVGRRLSEGASQKSIGDRIDCNKSQVSRILNGRTQNLTLKTISDILWACDFEHEPFSADAIEDISQNSGRSSQHLVYVEAKVGNGKSMIPICIYDAANTLERQGSTEIFWLSPTTVARL